MDALQANYTSSALRGQAKMRDRFEAPEGEDAKLAGRFLDVLNAFRTIDARMPANYVATFMVVALKPGYGPTEYAKMLGTIQPIASRWLLEVGIKAREKAEPLKLIDRVADPENLRSQKYFLTAEGRALFRQVVNLMRGGDK